MLLPSRAGGIRRLQHAISLVALTSGLIVLTGLPLPALAHSVIEGSLPPANASLESPPQDLVLRFSEPVDASFSSITVFDRDGRQVSARPIFARDGRQVTVPLAKLDRGVYTVRWRVLSAVDGHTTTGFYAFAVGVAIAQDGELAVAAASPSPTVVAFRWTGLVASILLAGIAFFQTGILWPSLERFPASEAIRLLTRAERALRMMTVFGAWILLVSLGGELVLQSMILLDAPLGALLATGALWGLLGTTRAGWGVLARASMALVLLLPLSPPGRILKVAALIWFLIVGGTTAVLGGLSAFSGPHVALLLLVASVYGLFSVMTALIVPQIGDVHVPAFRWVAPVCGALLLAGITLTSHAVGSGPIAVIADWLHLAAAALWIGGLGAFVTILRLTPPTDRAALARGLVSRVSTVAGIGLGVLALTGVYSAWLHLPSLQAFLVTLYGRTLLVKLLLFLPLVGLGAFNRFVMRPRLTKASVPRSIGPAVGRFVRIVGTELTLGGAILLAVAVLTIVPPARVSMPAPSQRALIFVGMVDDLTVRVSVTPALPGWNRIEVAVGNPRGQSLTRESRILLRVTKLDEALDRVTIPLSLRRGDAYLLEGGYIGLPGFWEVDVVIRQRGRPDVMTSFPVRIGDPPPTTSDPSAVQLLDRTRTVMATIRTWRQVDQLTDGAGGGILTRFEMVRPDRLYYRTSLGGEAIQIGATRYLREGSPEWRQETVPQPLALEGPYLEYLKGAEGVRRGRQIPCEDEDCQVVLWELPQVPATMAGWIGLTTFRVHKLLMVAPGHYMTSWPTGFDHPIAISPPR